MQTATPDTGTVQGAIQRPRVGEPNPRAFMGEPLLIELSSPGRRAFVPPPCDVPERDIAAELPASALRRELKLPEVAEIDLVRHYVRLSQRNYAIDVGFYPLGSCTMKFNPKVHEDIARLPGFADIHPFQPEETVQGAIELMYLLQEYLAEITGMAAVTLQPAAGAHGELTGMLLIRAHHVASGSQRTKVLVPDSAHGTNPATAAMCGYRVVTVPSDARGNTGIAKLRAAMDEEVAAVMMTVPSTLGLFEENILAIAEAAHAVGAQVYCDGANMNAMLGRLKPGDLGIDVMHINLHKTFSTPHGGGGPGAGIVAVKAHLAPYLPVPVAARRETPEGPVYYLDYDRPQSIGKVQSLYGNFSILVRAFTYIRSLGKEGLRSASGNAVLNANYLLERLRGTYEVAYDRRCMHEFVLTGRRFKHQYGVRTLDIAKRLIDYGFHPPTVYFPLIVEEALMVEPTETESRETLDAFADALLAVAHEAETNPELVRNAPYTTPVRRLDEALAARRPNLRWRL
jgi:glycine dehydrogenase subunit 2